MVILFGVLWLKFIIPNIWIMKIKQIIKCSGIVSIKHFQKYASCGKTEFYALKISIFYNLSTVDTTCFINPVSETNLILIAIFFHLILYTGLQSLLLVIL